MSHGRKVAISIGVSDAKPLPFLAGAINGARDFHTWATALGYESTLITDQAAPVTIARLLTEFERILDVQPAIYRFVLYFAGHGIIREAEDGLWLLSDWRKRLKGVQYEVLKRRLAMFGVQQISIFADACRSLPPDVLAADLDGDAVLGSGPIARPVMPPVDKFLATQDGERTFAVPGATEADDRCLFSGVLIEGLWGLKPSAFSAVRAGNVITSNSLGMYLKAEVPLRAASYESRIEPNVAPTFPEGSDIYFGDGARPTPPPFPPWPAPAVPDSRTFRGPAKGERRAVTDEEAPGPDEGLLRRIQQQNQKIPWQAFDTCSGFVVDGADVIGVWTNGQSTAAYTAQGLIRVGRRQNDRLAPLEDLPLPTPVLIQFSDGRFAATTALPSFVATVQVEQLGVSAVVFSARHEQRSDVEATARVLAQLESGSLRADDRIDIATRLRREKHADPVLGVISAYLYDSVGDTDSIRRMAYFYAQCAQPIPYDIALLGQLQGRWNGGELWVTVPSVGKREPRTDTEKQAEWTYRETGDASGVVGGLWPWMRQGWTFLDHPDDSGSTLVMPGLIELIPQLARARFATLDPHAGRRLIQLFSLEPAQPPG